MSTTQQPEALRLAELCDNFQKLEKIGTELRRQHARIAELEAQLSAIGAGGVEPLRKIASAQADVSITVEEWSAVCRQFFIRHGRAPLIDDPDFFNGIARLAVEKSATQPAAQGLDAETRRHAAIGAGGVEPLRKAPAAADDICVSALMFKISTLVDKRLSCEPCAEAEEDLLQFLRTRYAAPAHPAEGVPAQAVALLATGGQAQAAKRIAIDMKQTAELLDLFGGEPTEFTVMQCNGHSGPGLYAYVTEYPEDGASYLGKTDCEAQPAPKAQAAASTAGHGLEQFIEQVGDVHFQRCRVGSKEGAIRWDIEFGHYGDEVRGKTLREAITKALAAQTKQGGV